MNPPNSNLAETKSLLLGMVAEANDLKRTAGGSITDAVAGWLAPQYLLAAREKLSGTDSAARFEILRTFVQDWAMLRHGDHMAERLHIERERLKLAKRDTKQKWETKIQAGMDELKKEIKHNPKVDAAWEHLYELVMPDIKSNEEKEFREWLKRPEIRKEVFSELTRGLNPDTLKKVKEELYHFPETIGAIGRAALLRRRAWGRAAARHYRLLNVPVFIAKWYYTCYEPSQKSSATPVPKPRIPSGI